MEPATVIGLVTALAETYSDGFDDYETWKTKRTAENHYAGRGAATPFCALATSLAISGSQIRATYDKALSIVGADFATGDGKPSAHLIVLTRVRVTNVLFLALYSILSQSALGPAQSLEPPGRQLTSRCRILKSGG
jgi:hypothetical protein